MKNYMKPSVEEIKLTGIEAITAGQGGQAGGAGGQESQGTVDF